MQTHFRNNRRAYRFKHMPIYTYVYICMYITCTYVYIILYVQYSITAPWVIDQS